MKQSKSTPYESPSDGLATVANPALKACLRGGVAGLAAVPGSVLIAYGFLCFNHLDYHRERREFGLPPAQDVSVFGVGDLYPFAVWSIGLAMVIAFLVALVSRLILHLNPVLQAAVGIGLTTATGFGWTVGVYWLLGPWAAAFSFPVLYCWIGGSILAAIISQALVRVST